MLGRQILEFRLGHDRPQKGLNIVLLYFGVLDRVSDNRNYRVLRGAFRGRVKVSITAAGSMRPGVEAVALILQRVIPRLKDETTVRRPLQRHQRTLRLARCETVFRNIAPYGVRERCRDRLLSFEYR